MLDDFVPVSERLTPPPTYQPAHPHIVEWRPLTRDDSDVVLEIMRAMDAADHPNYLTTHEELVEQLGLSFVDLQRDSLLAVTADGRAVAVGLTVLPPVQETLVRSFAFGGVHPEFRGRGIGRELLAWQSSRAEQQLATSDRPLPAWIRADADARAPQSIRLLERGGFHVARYFVELQRDLAQPIAEVPVAEGVRVVQYAPEWSAATHAARTDSFRDHWGSQPMTEEQWTNFVGAETFRPELSFIAIAADADGADQVVGFVLSQVNEDDWVSQGFSGSYIGLVGTVRAWRGKRIAPALLARSLTAAADAGLERATLDVDAENPSGALGLYTRMGFVQNNTSVCLIREF